MVSRSNGKRRGETGTGGERGVGERRADEKQTGERRTADRSTGPATLNKECFGVFGDRDAFDRLANDRRFDAVAGGPSMTVGVRDVALGERGRTAVYEDETGIAVVWGEAYPPDDATHGAAQWLLERYAVAGERAFDDLNGSYLAAVDDGDRPVVATDPIRSWECFYTDAPGVRTFGSYGAGVGRTISTPTVDRHALLEFLHVGIVLGERTLLEELARLPIDGLLRPDGVTDLDRFVYRPQTFDYVGELATRIRRAIQKRRADGGRSGVLLSSGYDSRTLLAALEDVDVSYTIGSVDSHEVRGARRLADQYDCAHTALPPDERYLRPDESKVPYSNGVKESLHAHHAGYDDLIGADVVYHGLLFDTILRGYFRSQASVGVLGQEIPLGSSASDPDPVEALLAKIPYAPEKSRHLATAGIGPADPDAFVRDAAAAQFERTERRADRVHNHVAVVGIGNQPALPFRHHLADNYQEAFVAADAELIDWHLQAPPAQRSTETFLAACRRIDDDVLRHRPPDRPWDSPTWNTLAGYARAVLPFVESHGTSWPDRDALYDAHDLDDRLFPDAPTLHVLPSRHKLRFNDARQWIGDCLDREVSNAELLDIAR